MHLFSKLKAFSKFSVLLYFVLLCTFYSCDKKLETEDEILATCNKINENMSKYTVLTMNGYPDPEKRKIIGYFENNVPKLLIEEYYADTCRTFTNFYINGGDLIFARKESYIYNKPITYTEDSAKKNNDTVWYDDKKTVLKISSYLFKGNKLNKWLYNKNEIPANDKNFTSTQDELIGNCLFMLKMLKTKDD